MSVVAHDPNCAWLNGKRDVACDCGAANAIAIPRAQLEALMAAAKALEPFASIGQWLFARDEPDETPMVQFDGINGAKWFLTRGDFKAAHTALRTAGIDLEDKP